MVKKLLFLMALVLTTALPLLADEATVYDGTATNQNVPVYGLYCDSYQRSQSLYSASVLEDAGITAGATISAMTFHLTSYAAAVWTPTWEVYVFETSDAALTGFLSTTGLTPVATGIILDGTKNQMTIEFANNYTYNGGNLVFDLRTLTHDSNYKSATFAGASVNGGSTSGYSNSGVDAISPTARNFAPKTTFTFTPGAVTCARPDALDVENITENSAKLTWAGSASSYELIVNGVSSIESATAKTLTDLTPNTLYNVQVRAICAVGDTSSFRATTFRTNCAVVTGLWSEDFESYTAANFEDPCWINEHLAGNSGYVYKIVQGSSSSTSTNTSKLLQLPDQQAGNVTRLKLPTMDIPQANKYEFALDFYRSTYTQIKENEGVKVVCNGDTLGHIVRQYTVASATVSDVDEVGWYTYSFIIPVNGLVDLEIIGISEYGAASYMDNFRIQQATTCFPVKKAEIKNIDFTTADLEWIPGKEETHFHVAVVNGDQTLYEGMVDGTSLTITGLEASTTYALDITIEAVCDENDHSTVYTKTAKFTTLCDAITAPVWSEGFEGYEKGTFESPAPGCWSFLGANEGGSSTYPLMFINNNTTYVSAGSLSLYNQSSATKESYAILPQIADPQTKQIAFKYRSESASFSPTLTIGYMTDATDAASFVALSEDLAQSAGRFTEVEFPLDGIPAEDAPFARIAIRYNKSTNNNYYTGIDEILVEKIPTCFKSEGGIELAEVGLDYATINWLPSSHRNEIGYNVVIKNGADTIFNEQVADTFAIVRNLTPATVYSFNVEITSVCGPEDNSKAISATVDATTQCLTYVAPWVETFNASTDLPVCWDKNEGTAGAYVWTIENTASKRLDGNYIKFNSYSTSNNKWQKLVTPKTLLPANDETTLSFAWKNPTGGAMSILLTADGGMTFDTLRTDMEGQTDWAQDTISLDAYRNQEVSVVFFPVSNYGNGDAYVYLDNIAFNAPMYDILFVVNGDTVQAESVKYLTEVVYNGAAPTREATAQYTYTFKGWSEMIAPATGHRTYVAEFDSVVNQYEVIFKKWSGQILQREKLDYGTMPAFHGAEPFCEPTLAKVYTFVGWTPEIVEVTENAVYTAVLDSVDRKFKIDFVNEDGTLLKSDSIVYANKPAYTGATPTKASDAQYHYVFSGWDPVIISVYGDATYTAQFTPIARKYAITWKNADGSTLRVDSVAYGKVPAYKGTPAKEATAQYSYVFNGWTPAVDTVKADAAYTAQYNQVVNQYTVKVYAASGTITIDGEGDNFMVSKTVDYGTEVTIVATPLEGYEFLRWTDDNTENPRKVVVNGNVEFTAWFGVVPTQTGVENINAEERAVKFMKDGVLYIKRGDKIYDSTGKMVE